MIKSQPRPAGPPSIVINRATGEVTYRELSQEEKDWLWAQALCAQYDIEQRRGEG